MKRNNNEKNMNKIPKTISGISGEYTLVLHTGEHIYYIDEMEGDENANTIMMDTNMTILSDNYFANESLFEELQNLASGEIKTSDMKFISESCKYSIEEMRKDLECALMDKIIELQPRIAELIKTANVCTKNGIEINKYRTSHGYDGYDCYKQGTFVSNAISHHIGFIQGNGISFGYNPKTLITVMGIVNGGAYGKLDFHTNGIDTYSVHEDTKALSNARIEDMEKFLKEFNEFESAFYEYVNGNEISSIGCK